MTVTFSCTSCGRCCHGLRLPLSVDEATAWLGNGGAVQVFCEAIPWPEEPPAENVLAAYKRRRSFAATSGQLPVRVIVSLMATFEAACPNLLPDMRCGIYLQRPRACRVYPAEVNPFIPLEPAGKLCPPEAWQAGAPLQDDSGAWTDPEVDRSVTGLRDADARDAEAKARLCELLQISTAGLSNEGVVIHDPGRERMMAALASTSQAPQRTAPTLIDWHFVSHRQRTQELLQSASSLSMAASALSDPGASFMGFVPADPA